MSSERELLREWHDQLGAMIDQIGHPDYSLREMVESMRNLRDEMFTILAKQPAAQRSIDIVFDGPPSHESGRFVEVESPPGRSINFGEWVRREDGYWALRFMQPEQPAAKVPDGWKLVPVRPTADMLEAWENGGLSVEELNAMRGHYEDMLAAAPSPDKERK
jgi:hypothetical protein